MSHIIYLIGNAHLDPVWLWRWQEGFSEIKATFRSALDRMKEDEEVTFTSACAAYYEWVEQSDPAMFKEIQARVQEGRWSIVGGWYLQPDCNLPCGESFARHGLLSQRYFMDRFGVMARTGYNVDSFGHNGTLPQILRLSGMDHYVFMRPATYEKTLPKSLFDWQSADGSTVRTFRLPGCYCYNADSIEQAIPEVLELMRQEDTDFMLFYGIGNHGGGPTVQLLQKIKALRAQYPEVELRFSTVDAFFADTDAQAVPTVKDDLQFHAKGCYSAYSPIKRGNRLCENALLTAEKWNAVANALCGQAYPAQALTHAWKDVLFNQFHDILGGCCIRQAYTDASYLHGEAMRTAQWETNNALQKLSWAVDTVGDFDPSEAVRKSNYWFHEKLGTPVVVFNSLPWAVDAVVRLNDTAGRVTDEAGNALPLQQIRAQKTTGWNGIDRESICRVHVPALGYCLCHVFPDAKAGSADGAWPCTDTTLENDYLRLTFDEKTGTLIHLWDKRSQRELLGAPADAALMEETDSDTWAHGIYDFRSEAARFGQGTTHLMENGPVRSVLRVETRCMASTLKQDYILYAGKAEVEVRATVDFREHHKMLKLRFPVAAAENETLHAVGEIPFGQMERATDGGEQPCQQWCALYGETGGLSLANAEKYSFSADGNVLTLTALRGAVFADHTMGDDTLRDAECEYQEQGIQVFTYSLAPYCSPAASIRQACALNVLPDVIHETFHKGPLPTQFTGIRVSQENVIVTALKQAEDGDGLVLRAYEAEGKATDAALALPFASASWTAHFAPHEIKTFVLKQGEVRETDLLER